MKLPTKDDLAFWAFGFFFSVLPFAFAVSNAISQSVPMPVSTPVPTGPQIVNAINYGVSPANKPDANRIALQSLHDKLAANGGGTIVFGAGPTIYLDKGIIADSNVGFRGAGPGLTQLSVGGGGNAITTGIKRKLEAKTTPYSPTLTPDQFVDLFSLPLDGTAVSRAGQRWGLYTRGHTNLAQQGGPWDLGRGDGYRSARVLTLSLLLDFSNVTDAQWNQMSVWGMSIRGTACPMGLAIVRGQFFLSIGTVSAVDPFGDLPVVSNYWLGKPPRGICRFHCQVNADTGSVLSWTQGVQDIVTPQNKPLQPGRSFNANRFAPCGFGSLGENAATASDFTGGPSDLGILGARISDAPLFTDRGVGTAISRLIDKPSNDNLFFDVSLPGTIATLPLTDQPADVIATRQLTTKPSGQAMWLDQAHSNNWNSCSPGPIENLAIKIGDPKYGCAVSTGLHMRNGLRVDRCTLEGGARGIGAYNLGANYPLTVLDSTIAGSDAAVYCYFASQVSIERTQITGGFRDGVRLYRCADVTLRKIFSPCYSTPEFVEHPNFAVMAARSAVQIDGLSLDNESKPLFGCQVAAVYLSPDDSVPFTFATISGLVDSGSGPHASTVMLDDDRKAAGVGYKLTTRGFRLWNAANQKSVVRTVGTPSRWVLDIEQPYPLTIPWMEGPTVVVPTTPGVAK